MRTTALTLVPPPPTDTALRVLHVRTVAGNGGGPDKTILRSARYMPGLGVRAEALYLASAHVSYDALATRAADCGMPVHFAEERSAIDPAGAAAFARLVRRGQFDIVHTHDYKTNTLARLLLGSAGYRIVATAHGYNQTTTREGYYYTLERLLLRRADAVICPSHALADSLVASGVSSRRVTVIPNGVELDAWPFRPRRQPAPPLRILYVGRLSPEKNVPALLRACALLEGRRRRICLSLAGDGPQGAELRAHADELGLGPVVEFLGHRTDVQDVLAQADVFVNPSLTEAMPNAVLEALASGVPVVATDVGDTARLVLHEQTGLLVPPDDPAALADAIGRLADAPDFAQHLAVCGRSHVERHFNFANTLAHVVAVYRGVVAAERRAQ